jgi:hypothetical protein
MEFGHYARRLALAEFFEWKKVHLFLDLFPYDPPCRRLDHMGSVPNTPEVEIGLRGKFFCPVGDAALKLIGAEFVGNESVNSALAVLLIVGRESLFDDALVIAAPLVIQPLFALTARLECWRKWIAILDEVVEQTGTRLLSWQAVPVVDVIWDRFETIGWNSGEKFYGGRFENAAVGQLFENILVNLFPTLPG